MIIVKIQHGLGNQMFQYAVGKHLAVLNNTKLKLDISTYDNQNKTYIPRIYSIGHFNIVENFSTKTDTHKMKLPQMATKNIFSRLYRKIFRDLEAKKTLNKRVYINEPYFDFCEDILKIKGDTYLSGNWQNEKYFKDIRDIICKDFTIKTKSSTYENRLQQILSTDRTVSLHIRRGDYIDNESVNRYYGVCSTDYYKKATNIMAQKVQSPVFFIFSDDIEWVKENLKIEYPMIFVSGGSLKDYEELILMSKCKHNIIANSSFSWWGAWLNNNTNKIVIAPKKWFQTIRRPYDNPCPNDWVKI